MKKLFVIFPVAVLLSSMCALAQETSVSGIQVQKTSTYENGVGEITLEAFSTGQTVKKIVETHVPTDIVLVLDVSGSMSGDITFNGKKEITSGELTPGVDYKVVINGQEYYLKGFKETVKDGYRYEAVTGDWTYNKVKDGTYYYKDGSTYYQVSASYDSNGIGYYKSYSYYLYYSYKNKYYQTVLKYLKGSGTSDSKNTVKKKDDVIYSGTLYKKVETGPVTTYSYRYSTKKIDKSSSGSAFYTGESNFTVGSSLAEVSDYKIYTVSSSTVSKLDALKTAATDFVSQIAADASNYGIEHRISIVKFAGDNKDDIGNSKNKEGYNYSQIVNDFLSAKDNAAGLKSTIKSLASGGGTRAHLGMTHAKDLILGSTTRNFPGSDAYYKGKNISLYGKVVVMFTDGEPGEYGFDKDNRGKSTYKDGWWVANQTVALSKDMKDKGVEVYTIGVITNPGDDVKHYLDLTSSNYPAATKAFEVSSSSVFRVSGGTKADDIYYQMSDGADLSDIFQTIANESLSGGAIRKELDATTVLKDILNPDFNLPEGATASDIKVYVRKCTGCTPDPDSPNDADRAVYTFSDELTQVFPDCSVQSLRGITATAVKKDGRDVIDISGFSYRDYWCGNENNNGKVSLHAGYKIVVKVPFTITTFHDDYSTYETNAPESGLYSDSGKNLVIPFPIPELYSIIIEKDGLEAGETAVFNVFKKGADGSYGETPVYTTMMLGGENVSESGKDVQIIGVMGDGTYKVVEDTVWSWSYDVDKPSEEHTLSDAQLVKFSFVNTKKSTRGDNTLPLYAEATVTNEMGTDATNSSNSTDINN